MIQIVLKRFYSAIHNTAVKLAKNNCNFVDGKTKVSNQQRKNTKKVANIFLQQTFSQNQRKNLQSPGKNKLSYLGGKVKVKNQNEIYMCVMLTKTGT